jgi:hypothetical protein
MEDNYKKLSKEEKVIVMMYKKKLEQNVPIEKILELLNKVNQIHLKYPDFCMYDVP